MRISSSGKPSGAARAATDAMLLASAVILSYIESFIPLILAFPLPGIKLGLANIAVMAAAYDIGGAGCKIGDAAVISFVRIFLMALMFGSVTTLWFSLLGGIISFIMLIIFRFALKGHVSVIGTSIACAAGHNSGQIIAAVTLFGEGSLFYFLPWLLLLSVVTGFATGLILALLSGRLHKSGVYDNL